MRYLFFSLALISLQANAQSDTSRRWSFGFGITEASMNFHRNGEGSLTVPIRYNILQSHNAALSIGTKMKLGTEDEDGISFPILLAAMALSNGNGDWFGNDDDNTRISFFGDFPVLLHFNAGLGSTAGSTRRFGFFLGGGMTYTFTGFTNDIGHSQSTSFPAWVADVGIRFAKNTELGFSLVRPLRDPVGNINNPILYELHFLGFR